MLVFFFLCCWSITSSFDAYCLSILQKQEARKLLDLKKTKQLNSDTLLESVNWLLAATWNSSSSHHASLVNSEFIHFYLKLRDWAVLWILFVWFSAVWAPVDVIVPSAVATNAHQPVNVTNPAWPPIIKSTVIGLMIVAQFKPQWTIPLKFSRPKTPLLIICQY